MRRSRLTGRSGRSAELPAEIAPIAWIRWIIVVQILAFFVAKLSLLGTHPGASRRQHDLPNVGAAFHQCMRRGCLG